jgi:hypothetical protein
LFDYLNLSAAFACRAEYQTHDRLRGICL